MRTPDVRLKIQCDTPAGVRGTFLYDRTDDRVVSPVCEDCVELFAWMRREGWAFASKHDISDNRVVYTGVRAEGGGR